MMIKHLQENNISYTTHMKRSIAFSLNSFAASMYFFIHAFFPFILEHHGSRMIKKISEDIKKCNNEKLGEDQ